MNEHLSKYNVTRSLVPKWAKSLGMMMAKMNDCGFFHNELNLDNIGRDKNGNWKMLSARSIQCLKEAIDAQQSQSPRKKDEEDLLRREKKMAARVHHKELLNYVRIVVYLYNGIRGGEDGNEVDNADMRFDLQLVKKNNDTSSRLLSVLKTWR